MRRMTLTLQKSNCAAMLFGAYAVQVVPVLRGDDAVSGSVTKNRPTPERTRPRHGGQCQKTGEKDTDYEKSVVTVFKKCEGPKYLVGKPRTAASG